MTQNAKPPRATTPGAVLRDQAGGQTHGQRSALEPARDRGRIARERTRALLRARAVAAGRRLLTRADEEQRALRRRAGELARDRSVAG